MTRRKRKKCRHGKKLNRAGIAPKCEDCKTTYYTPDAVEGYLNILPAKMLRGT
jgi:hypothetical protein